MTAQPLSHNFCTNIFFLLSRCSCVSHLIYRVPVIFHVHVYFFLTSAFYSHALLNIFLSMPSNEIISYQNLTWHFSWSVSFRGAIATHLARAVSRLLFPTFQSKFPQHNSLILPSFPDYFILKTKKLREKNPPDLRKGQTLNYPFFSCRWMIKLKAA